MTSLLKTYSPCTAAEALKRAGIKNIAPFKGLILPFTPRSDQVAGVNKMLKHSRAGLFAETRTGKTIIMQLVVLYTAHYGYKTIMLMPPILFDQFKETWDDIGGTKPAVHTLSQGPAARDNLFSKWSKKTAPGLLLMTQQIFIKVWPKLAKLGYRQLIFDESHLGLQKDTTQTYGAIKEFLGSDSDTRLILSTGTPVPTGADGAYPSIQLLTPGVYMDKRHFDRWHVRYSKITVRNNQGKEVLVSVPDSFVNLEELHENLYAHAHRVTKAQVLDLKRPNIQVTPVTLHPKHMALYRSLLKSKFLEIGERMIQATNQAKLRQLAGQLTANPHLYSEASITNHLFAMVEELLDSLDVKRNKVVLFANYNQTVNSLVDRLPKLKPARVYGGEGGGSAKNRKEVKRFQENESCRVLVANPQAGGVGLTLGHVCTNAIVVEPMSSPGQFEQAVSRVLLSGQKEPVVVYILSAQGTAHLRAIELMLGRARDNKTVNADKQTLLDELLPDG